MNIMKTIFIILISMINACGTAEQEKTESCVNYLRFVSKSISRSFETLTYSGSICLRGLNEIPGLAVAVITIETLDGEGEIDVKSTKINDQTFQINLPSNAKSFSYILTRPAVNHSEIPYTIRTSKSVMGNRG